MPQDWRSSSDGIKSRVGGALNTEKNQIIFRFFQKIYKFQFSSSINTIIYTDIHNLCVFVVLVTQEEVTFSNELLNNISKIVTVF